MKIVVINQKGGVGKSSVTVNLGHGLAKRGKKTLIVDLDPQAHSSVIYCCEPDETISDLFEKKTEFLDVIYQAAVVKNIRGKEKIVDIKNLGIIPSDIHLATASEKIPKTQRKKLLDSFLKTVGNEFEYILIDCPPSLGVLTVMAVYTADLILITTNYSKYSLDGISDLFRVVENVRGDDYDYRILRNCKNTRSPKTNEVIEDLLAGFRKNLLKTVVRKSEPINQAQMINLPVQEYSPNSTGAKDFNALRNEIIRLK